MKDPAEGISINMERVDLTDIPQFELPAPYSFRWFRPGDEQDWVDIHVDADNFNESTINQFYAQFGTDDDYTAGRMCFLCDGDGQAVGTASAWHMADLRGVEAGRVHWVAIVERLHGRGLAKPMLTAVLNRMVELGYERACLDTDTRRLPAVNLYLSFGFRPHIPDEDQLRAWQWVRERLPDSPLKDFPLKIG